MTVEISDLRERGYDFRPASSPGVHDPSYLAQSCKYRQLQVLVLTTVELNLACARDTVGLLPQYLHYYSVVTEKLVLLSLRGIDILEESTMTTIR